MSNQRINRTSRFPTPIGFPGYILAPNGGQVFYVDSGGIRDEYTADIASMLFTTLAGALNACRANRGDTIICMPQHTENVGTTTPTFVNGVKIVGVGNGAERPTFSWTATGSVWTIAANNVWIENLVLDTGQANGVTKAIAVTGTDAMIFGCEIITTTDATHKATIALELGTGASRARVWNCKFRGAAGTSSTDVLKVAGTGDQIEIVGCRFACASTAGNGNIHITGAATNILIADCICNQTVASGTAAIAIDDVASTGFIVNCDAAVLNNGTVANQGIVFAGVGTTTIRTSRTYATDEPGKNSAIAPGASS